MARKNLAEILREAKVDPRREYERLYMLFYEVDYSQRGGKKLSLRDICGYDFSSIPFKGTCLTLDDFESTHKLHFVLAPPKFDIDYLIFFCEFTYNLAIYAQSHPFASSIARENPFVIYIQQVRKVIELLGYMETRDGMLTIFAPKSPAAISAAEISEPKVSYKIIEYNHYSMKGDLDRKLATLKVLADEIEPRRSELKSSPGSVESELFQMLQKFVRHNNRENPVIAAMKPEELEAAYDDIYQMWLLAVLELDNVERKKRAKELLGKING